MRTLPWLLCVCLLGITNAPAYGRHLRTVTLAPECNVSMPCDGGYYGARAKKFIGIPFGAPLQSYTPQRVRHQTVPTRSSEVIGGRPSGCPHAYCGCGTSLRLFGKIIPELNLARNWGKFPPAAPAPGMAAYNHRHVFAIESVNADGTVVAYDSNSGRGLTRLHTVSLRGYRVVSPRA